MLDLLLGTCLLKKAAPHLIKLSWFRGPAESPLFGLQITAAFGATGIATSSSDEKPERAKALDVYHTINHVRTPDLEKE